MTEETDYLSTVVGQLTCSHPNAGKLSDFHLLPDGYLKTLPVQQLVTCETRDTLFLIKFTLVRQPTLTV